MKRARLILALLMLALASPAAAQTANQFAASETTTDAFALSRPDDLGHLRYSAQLHLDYANDPVNHPYRIVEHQLTGNLGLALGLADRYVVFAGAPVHLMVDGDDAPMGSSTAAAQGGGMGDLYVGARARLLGDASSAFAIAAQGTLTLPTGGEEYRGDDGLTAHIELLPEFRAELIRLTANVGVLFRGKTDVGEAELGHDLTYGLGITAPLYGDYRTPTENRVDLHIQLHGALGLRDLGHRETSRMEALVGVKFHHESGFVIGVAGGGGVLDGYGSPDGRAILNLGYSRLPEAAPEEEEVVDADGDGVNDDADQCIGEAEDADGFEDEDGCPDLDNDGDGVPDADDQCTGEGEDVDGFQDEDGCPDLDNDEDGIPDSADQCAGEGEDVDGFQDEDGCPDLDNDGDGIPDAEDQCASEAGVAETHGCPDPDRDGDGVPDRLDNCPEEAGTVENEGCEAEQRVRIRGAHIEILDKVYFASGRNRIQRRSFSLLENVAAVLRNHPEISHVVVEGHTDNRGRADRNQSLSQERAQAVVDWLVRRGEVPAERLEARGFGSERPIADNDTAEGRASNRRVEFTIVPVEGAEEAH